MENISGRAYVINANDNVATAISNLMAGKISLFGSVSESEFVFCQELINMGHKVAIRPIKRGEAVIKYGAVIGTATVDIETGCCVHFSNMRTNCQLPQNQSDNKFSFEYEVY